MLQYPKLREYLKKSSEKSFCSENVDFYEAILEFKTLKKQEDRNKKAVEIYYRFLELGAINEVNLSESQKRALHQSLENNPSKSVFDSIDYEIQNMIKTENYYRFIHSEEDFGKMLEENENIIFITRSDSMKRTSSNF